MPSRQSSAVVLGASMGGLMAARALSGRFERVTIVERDVLPEGDAVRKGVPQSAHAHGLLASGYRVMDEYFPGMMDELEARGAPRGDVVGDFLWFQYGRWKLRHDSGLRGITVSRPCLETAIRRRIKALANVTFRENTDAFPGSYDEPRDPTRGRVEPRLHDSLAARLDGLSRRFYGRARKIVDIPWAIATGEDLRFPKVEGRRPPGFHVINRYLERVHDPVVCRRFFDVLNLLASPASLLSPPLVWRVLARAAPKGESSPWGTRRPA